MDAESIKSQRILEVIKNIDARVMMESFSVEDASQCLKVIKDLTNSSNKDICLAVENVIVKFQDDCYENYSEFKNNFHSIFQYLNNYLIHDAEIEIKNCTFVLSGDFDVDGGKDTLTRMIEIAQGNVTKNVSGKTDYLVVGNNHNPKWAYGRFGTKVMKAIGLNIHKNKGIKIIDEPSIIRALGTNNDVLSYAECRSNAIQYTWDNAKVAVFNDNGFTRGQQDFLNAFMSGENIYLTGLAGTGKSFILEKAISLAKAEGRNVIVCAPTGIAALNVGGSTIHRVLGIRPNDTLGLNISPWISDDSALRKCDILVIDEISMCRMDVFDYLSAAIKRALSLTNRNIDEFQLVVIGDFCQLPPVVTREIRPILNKKYGREVGGAYAFLGSEWNSWKFIKIELTEAIRQKDSDFVRALNTVRIGGWQGIEWIQQYSSDKPHENAISICGKNRVAEKINEKKLGEIDEQLWVYKAAIEGDVTDADKPTYDTLKIKLGARVIALVNNSEDTFMNGSLGTVISCCDDVVTVLFDNRGTSEISPHKWEITKPIVRNGKTEKDVVGTFQQIPLKLAWAITIHKSQGQTFNSASVFPECWECGQLYTALSRLSDIDGLYLEDTIIRDYLKTSSDVLTFIES